MVLSITNGKNAEFYKNIRDDEVSQAARNKALIMNYGNGKYSRRDVEEHTHNTVSKKMREMSRLVIHGRKMLSH